MELRKRLSDIIFDSNVIVTNSRVQGLGPTDYWVCTEFWHDCNWAI